MSQPYPDVVRACHAEQFSAIESKYRNRLLLEGDSSDIRFGLFQISHFRKNYLNTIFRYHDLSDEIADQSLSRLMLAQAHTQAGNIKDAKEILVDFTPVDDEDKRNALGMLAELSGLEKDVDALKQAMASLYPEPDLSRNYLRYQYLVYELEGDGGSGEDLLRSALQKPLSPQVEATVASLLATKLDRDGAFSEAFDFASRGARVLDQSFPKVDQTQLANDVICSCPDPLVSSENDDQRPTFVIGMPRSGTTLLESILAAHSNVGGVGESPDPIVMMELASHRLKCSMPNLYAKFTPSMLNEFGMEQMLRLDSAGASGDRIINKALWLDRYVGILAAMFPHAQFLWIHRDPRDNLLSCFLHYIGAPQATTLARLIDARVAHEKLMRHWQNLYPERIFEVSYEDLVADFKSQVHQILKFLKLPIDDSCLKFHQSDRVVMTPSREQVRKPINASAVARWRKYEPFLEELCHAFPNGKVMLSS